MSEYTERFTMAANGFGSRVAGVADADWDSPAPCDGWVARDIVRHLVEWVPAFFTAAAGLTFADGPSVADDPVGAWTALRTSLERQLADPATASREFDSPMGHISVEQAIDMIVTGDVFLHTWDLARATGQDETLDPDQAQRMFEGMEPMDEMLRNSGQYGPRVVVADEADVQTKLIAFIGRDPAWRP